MDIKLSKNKLNKLSKILKKENLTSSELEQAISDLDKMVKVKKKEFTQKQLINKLIRLVPKLKYNKQGELINLQGKRSETNEWISLYFVVKNCSDLRINPNFEDNKKRIKNVL